MPELAKMDLKTTRLTGARVKAIFCMTFFALGSLFPMLSQFFGKHDIDGEPLGRLLAIGPVVALFAQPFWGYICDRFRKQKEVFVLTLLTAAGLALLFVPMQGYMTFVFLLIGLQFFQSPLVPVADAYGLNHTKASGTEYGTLRMWGALGFAFGVFVTGYVVTWTSIDAIFFIFAASLAVTALLGAGMPNTQERLNIRYWSQMNDLFRLPRYVLFLLSAFFVFGPMNANNFYFALLYEDLGGAAAGLGLAFLLFAGSEAPFMKWTDYVIRRWGMEATILVGSAVSAVRWIWYSTTPPKEWIICFFFLQGISIGFFLVTGSQYVRKHAPRELQVTALALYTSAGMGLGTMTMNYLGGVAMDIFSIRATYLLFALSTVIGLLPMLIARHRY